MGGVNLVLELIRKLEEEKTKEINVVFCCFYTEGSQLMSQTVL